MSKPSPVRKQLCISKKPTSPLKSTRHTISIKNIVSPVARKLKPESAVFGENKANQFKILNATINLELSQKLNGKVLSTSQRLFTSSSQQSLARKVNLDADPIQLKNLLLADHTPVKIPRRKQPMQLQTEQDAELRNKDLKQQLELAGLQLELAKEQLKRDALLKQRLVEALKPYINVQQMTLDQICSGLENKSVVFKKPQMIMIKDKQIMRNDELKHAKQNIEDLERVLWAMQVQNSKLQERNQQLQRNQVVLAENQSSVGQVILGESIVDKLLARGLSSVRQSTDLNCDGDEGNIQGSMPQQALKTRSQTYSVQEPRSLTPIEQVKRLFNFY